MHYSAFNLVNLLMQIKCNQLYFETKAMQPSCAPASQLSESASFLIWRQLLTELQVFYESIIEKIVNFDKKTGNTIKIIGFDLILI